MNNVNEATDQILGLLHEKDIGAKIAYGLVFEAGVEHRRVSLPILKRKEMEALVRREVKKNCAGCNAQGYFIRFLY